MPHDHSSRSPVARPPSAPARGDWRTIRTLLPYLMAYRGRVALALSCLVAAKLANVGVPLVLKQIVDRLTPSDAGAQMLVLPLALLVAYGALRLSTTAFTELREYLFAKVTQRAVRTIALKTFRHLHALSLRFHLARQTGGLTRDVERGTRGISSLIGYTLFSILPTLIEILLVSAILVARYDFWFVGITLGALILYIVFTVSITEWRTNFRRQMNELDSKANTRAIDSLLNYETVKYFNNEEFEARRYDDSLQRWEKAAVKSQTSLSLLNIGQSAIVAVAVTLIMWRATLGVVNHTMSIGDLVLVNAFMIQLYIPLNFLGVIYREIKQAVADMERMFELIEINTEVNDAPGAAPLRAVAGEVRFEHVDFGYESNRQILFDVSFSIPAGRTIAVVGPSGSGKSTLARLLYRFYDEIVAAARLAQIHDFVSALPEGYKTPVGERGLKLSGGEKQRVAIARAILKNPRILIFDEATSALDSKSEKLIQAELELISVDRTTLTIAHRLSTIVHADQIIVLEHGRIIERGTHGELLAAGGAYARMWALQQQEKAQTSLAVPAVEAGDTDPHPGRVIA
jgi:ATP-binding cassette subfamily B protein